MNGPILVTGGTGTLGRPLVTKLLADGADVRVMSRRPRPEGDDRPCGWAEADLVTGRGLDEAVSGVATIVHCATTVRKDVAVTRKLVEAARRAGQPHLVYVSIVGIDQVPFSYYRAKLAAERVVEESELPWTVLRATQFHDLVAGITLAQRWLPLVVVPSGFRFQPVEVAEVADRLVELVRGGPVGRAADLGGPRVRDARELARATLRAAGRRRVTVPMWLPGRTARAFRAGGNLAAPDRATGTVTFETYLAERAEAGTL